MPPFDQLVLHTHRLTLRPLMQSDAHAIYDIFSEPEMLCFWSTAAWSTVQQAEEMIARDLKALPLGEMLRLGIVENATKKLIGNCSLFEFSEPCRRAELGYGMTHAAWGHGLMHEALSALIDYAFDELDLIRIQAFIDPANTRSAHSLERLGCIKEGHLRQHGTSNGKITDTGIYGLLRSDWRK